MPKHSERPGAGRVMPIHHLFELRATALHALAPVVAEGNEVHARPEVSAQPVEPTAVVVLLPETFCHAQLLNDAIWLQLHAAGIRARYGQAQAAASQQRFLQGDPDASTGG